MAYVGSEGSSSGFHRCFSSTVALNLLVASDDRHVVCIGTDFDSQTKYDAFMSARGISPHVDWLNLGPEEMKKADFPLYVYDQKVGDLVVFPPATAHQVWNPATLSTKLVWNILHPLSLEVGFQYVQPPFNRLCHPDVARTNLSLAFAMRSLITEGEHIPLPPDLPLLSRLFRQMVHDESIEGMPATRMQLLEIGDGVVATCNFCNTAIWNRHVRCTECDSFDLCLACYINGRSCEHNASYAWAEIVPQDTCTRVLNRAREILGFQPEEPRVADRCRTLGTAVNDLMRAKQNPINRLCHLCRIDHQEWKGRRCDKCTAFFCYRGLYRHFDINSADVLKHSGMWTCPKCHETCNCRCCHFTTAYRKSEKPASKRRVKPFDPRGKTMGFTDNVFDQKRGHRTSNGHSNGPKLPGVAQITSKKRSLTSADIAPAIQIRRMELPTPEPDYSNRIDLRPSREGSDYPIDSQYSSVHSNGTLPGILPSLGAFSDEQGFSSPLRDRSMTSRLSPAISSLNTSARSSARDSTSLSTTLPPMLSNPPMPRNPVESTAFSISGTATATPLPSHAMHHTLPFPNLHHDHIPNHTSNPLIPDQIPDLHLHSRKLGVSSPQELSPSTIPPHITQTPIRTTSIDTTITQLEDQIASLRRYESEFLSLNLEDSRRLLAAQMQRLEQSLEEKRREKSLVLVERLRREGFADLAEGVRRELEGLSRELVSD